jgi:hypothetical protein
MKLIDILEEIIIEAEETAVDPNVAELEKAMGDAFKNLGSEFEANKQEVQQDVENADVPVNEAITTLTIIGILLAMPKVLELFGKGLSKFVLTFKKLFRKGGAKTEEDKVRVAEAIIEFSHKWHKAYIKGIKYLLKMSGVYKKAKIVGDANQEKVAEVIFYVIIAGLALYSGVGAISAFKAAAANAAHGGHLAMGGLESAMAAIKSGEVQQFLQKLAIK